MLVENAYEYKFTIRERIFIIEFTKNLGETKQRTLDL